MTQFGKYYIPSLRAFVNVGWETVKSQLPEQGPCMDVMMKMTGKNEGESSTQGEHTHFGNNIQQKKADGTIEMSTMKGYGGVDECGSKDFQTSRSNTFSMGGSFDEGGGGEFGSRHKINEWQAAWNVTNAIQVCPGNLKVTSRKVPKST